MNADAKVLHADTGRLGVVTRQISPTYVSVHWLDDATNTDEHIADLEPWRDDREGTR
jgi:hypothetical protein